jgi:hypothetical protein
MLLRSLFRNLSLFLQSIPPVSSPLLSPPCLWIVFPHPLLFPISCSSFSYSPVKVPSSGHTFFPVFFSLPLRHIFFLFSSLYCILSLFSTYMNFSFHASFFFSLFLSLFANPQFHPSYYSHCSSPFSFSLFVP